MTALWRFTDEYARRPRLNHFLSEAGHQSSAGAEQGTTAGWLDGQDVTFFYNKDFFCKEPPASEAASDRIVGAEPQTAPRGGNVPVVSS